jgi:hypothetical protein
LKNLLLLKTLMVRYCSGTLPWNMWKVVL